MARTPLGPIDHAWLRMERPDNPMMITGVLTFDEPLDIDRLRATIAERIRPFARLTQRIRARSFGRAEWEDVPSFRVEDHVHHRHLPPPADRGVLQREIAALVSTPLPFDRPLWQLDVLENPIDGRSVLVARLHHCVADGFALMNVLLGFTDAGPDGATTEAPHSEPPRPARSPRPSARALLSGATAVGADLARLAALRNQPASILRGQLGPRKRAAWSAPVPLAQVKAIGHAVGGTVNDVLMTVTAGALGRYLDARGESPRGFDLRTAVPVNLRTPGPIDELGNYFGLVFLELPIGIDDALARFHEVKRRMDRLKHSPEPAVLLAVMKITGAGPRWMEEIVVRVLGAKTTAVLTNVPGPREPRYMAGRRIRTIMFWVPQAGRVGLGISIFSYAGEVRLGIAGDARLVPDPERILELFPSELEALGHVAG